MGTSEESQVSVRDTRLRVTVSIREIVAAVCGTIRYCAVLTAIKYPGGLWNSKVEPKHMA